MVRSSDYRKGDFKKAIPFLAPSFLGVSIFVLLPFIDVFRRSFTTATATEFVFLENYQTVLSNKAFQLAVKNNLRFLGICIPILIILSLSIAVFLYQKTGIANLIKSGFLLPMAIPVASVVLLWKLLFHENGFVNGLFNLFHLPNVDWMGSDYAFGVLVFSYIWRNLGYQIILWLAGLAMIPPGIYEAASVDGATKWQCFMKITFPNLIPVFSTVTILSVLNSFKVFREAYLVAGEYPHESIYLLQHLFNNWFRDLAVDKIAAASMLLTLTMLGLIILLQRTWGKELEV